MKAWGNKLAQKYFEKQRTKYSDLYLGEKVLLNLCLKENMSILDIGCAQGGFYKIIKSRIKKFNYTGIDGNYSMIEKAKKKYPSAKFCFLKKNNFKILKKKYDLVLVLGVLHLTPVWKKILFQAKKLSKKYLIFDLRETSRSSIINNKKKSFFSFDHKSHDKLPYNILNTNYAKLFLNRLFKKNIIRVSYGGRISKHAKSKLTNIEFANYCVYKKKINL